MLCCLLCVICTRLAAQPASQSRLLLHNGDQLTGQILTQTAATVTLLPAYSSAIVIQRTDIKKILQLTAPTAMAVATAQNNAVATPAETAPRNWSLEVDVSASSRHGKENSNLLNMVSKAEYQQNNWRSALDLHYDYEMKEQAPKTHQYKISPGLDYYLQPRLFWRLTTDYHYNYLAADYKNIDLSTGPGYAVVQHKRTQLDLTLMAGLKRASFRDTEPVRNLLQTSALSYHFVAMEWDFKHKFSQFPLEFYSEGNLMKLLNQPLPYLDFNYELVSATGLRYRLSDQIRLSWSYDYNLTDLEAYLPRQNKVSFDIKDLRQKLSIGASF